MTTAFSSLYAIQELKNMPLPLVSSPQSGCWTEKMKREWFKFVHGCESCTTQYSTGLQQSYLRLLSKLLNELNFIQFIPLQSLFSFCNSIRSINNVCFSNSYTREIWLIYNISTNSTSNELTLDKPITSLPKSKVTRSCPWDKLKHLCSFL